MTNGVEEKIEHIDQLIYRFMKLQDSMGTRLFPSVYAYIENDDAPKPFFAKQNTFQQSRLMN